MWKVPAWMRGLVSIALTITIVLVVGTFDSRAQATPTPSDLDVPAPQECDIEPRELPFFAEGSRPEEPATPAPLETAPAEPFVVPSGEAPDDETVAAVTATVRESLACRNANDFLRAYALFTDDMLLALFGGPATVDPDVQAVIADEVAKPVPPRERIALACIDDIVKLPDGRVGAVVETLNARQPYRDFLIFEQDAESGRWLIDEMRVMG